MSRGTSDVKECAACGGSGYNEEDMSLFDCETCKGHGWMFARRADDWKDKVKSLMTGSWLTTP